MSSAVVTTGDLGAGDGMWRLPPGATRPGRSDEVRLTDVAVAAGGYRFSVLGSRPDPIF